MESMISKTTGELEEREFYIRIFEFMNLMQEDPGKQLNNTEIRLLVEFLLLPEPDFKGYLRFRKKGKETALKNYNAQYNKSAKSHYVYINLCSLRSKGVLYKEDDGIYLLNPFIENNILNKKEFKIGMIFKR